MKKNGMQFIIALILSMTLFMTGMYPQSNPSGHDGYPGKVSGDGMAGGASTDTGGSQGTQNGNSSNDTGLNPESSKSETARKEMELLSQAQENLYRAYESGANQVLIDKYTDEVHAHVQNLTALYIDSQQEGQSTKESRKENGSTKDSATPPETKGDPVLISSKQYYIEDSDTSFRYGKNTFAFERNVLSSVKPNGALGKTWSCSLDTRIIRGADTSANSYCAIVEDTIAKVQNAVGSLDTITLVTAKRDEVLREKREYISKLQDVQQQYESIKAQAIENRQMNKYVQYGPYTAPPGNDSLLYVTENGGCSIFTYSPTLGRYVNSQSAIGGGVYITLRNNGAQGFTVHYGSGKEKWYDKWGLPEYYTDQYGSRIDFVHDEKNQKVVAIKHNGKKMLSFSWLDNGLLESIHNEVTNKNVTYTYTGMLLTGVTDEQNDVYGFEYDSDGDITSLIKPDGSKNTVVYGKAVAINARGPRKIVIATKNEESFSETFEESNGTRTLVYTDADGCTSSYDFDAAGNMVTENCADGNVVHRTYNGNGDVVKKTDVFGTMTFAYDAKGNVCAISYDDGTKEIWSYRNEYNVVDSYTDRDGVITKYTYDSNGFCTGIVRDEKTISVASANSWGGVASMNVCGNDHLYEYNDKYAVTKDKSNSYEYDAAGNLVKIDNGHGNVWKYTYSADGKIYDSLDPYGLSTRIEENNRKDISKIVQRDTKSGKVIVTKIEYDKRHLPVSLYRGEGDSETLAEKAMVCKETCSYSAAGRLLSYIQWNSDVAARHDGNGICTAYTYTQGGELSTEAHYFVDENNLKKGSMYKKTYMYSYANGEKCTKVLSCDKVILFSYSDVKGNIIRVIDGEGRKIAVAYSPAGKQIGYTNMFGGTTKYVYDNAYSKISVVSKNGIIMKQCEFDSQGRMSLEKNVDGLYTSYLYEDNEDLKSIYKKSSAGNSDLSYDVLGRITKYAVHTNDAGQLFSYTYTYAKDNRTCVRKNGIITLSETYDAWGNVIYSSENGERYEYDADKNKVCVRKEGDDADHSERYFYTADGKISKVIHKNGSVEDFYYNACGQLVKHTDDCGIVWQGVYDDFGNLIMESGRLVPVREYVYDKGGIVVEIKEAGETVEKRTYAADMRTLYVTDARGNKTVYTYDSDGQLSTLTNRLGKTMKCSFDYALNKKTTTDFAGVTTTITYNPMNRLLETQSADNEKTQIYFDAVGSVIKTIDAVGETNYRYDYMHELSEIKNENATIKYNYDAHGQKTKIASQGMSDVFTYNKNNQIENASLNEYGVSFKYDDAGRKIASVDKNGNGMFTEYDASGREILVAQKNHEGQILFAEKTVYDENGYAVCKTDADGSMTQYEYDDHGRLSQIKLPFITAYEDATKELLVECGKEPESRKDETCWTETYVYDKNGNCVSRKTPVGTLEYQYDEENRLVKIIGPQPVTIMYDDNGNMIEKNSFYRFEKYMYNKNDRVSEAAVTDKRTNLTVTQSFTYDALGRRKTERKDDGTVLYSLYDGVSFTRLAEYPMNTTLNARPAETNKYRYRNISQEKSNVESAYCANTRYFMYTNDVLQFQVTDSGMLSYCTDSHGSVHSVMDSSGAKVCLVRYDAEGTPFVNTVTSSDQTAWTKASNVATFGIDNFFCGKKYNATSQSYNFGCRDYSTSLARFTTVDPICDGRNWYTYCNGDPVNFFDPDGRQPLRGSDPHQSENEEFCDILRGLRGTDYELGGADSSGIDCSGTVMYALNELGYTLTDTSAAAMSDGSTPWITKRDTVDVSAEGDPGMLNFYYSNDSQSVGHVNTGVGHKEGENGNQIIDATKGSWMKGRNSNPNQIYKAESDSVNQTYVPFSTNSDPVAQGTINWAKLHEMKAERNTCSTK